MALRPKAKSRVGAESRNAKGTKLDVLRMVLRHGDIVVMHGTGIQKLYEVRNFRHC
jgi:alkylated DNA repair dioxygenase AlkB